MNKELQIKLIIFFKSDREFSFLILSVVKKPLFSVFHQTLKGAFFSFTNVCALKNRPPFLRDDIQLNLALHIKGKQALKNMEISTDIVLNHKFFFTERAEHPSTLQHKIKTEGKLVYGNL